MGKDHEAMLDRACEARAAFWREWGELEEDVLAPVINPGLRGLPAWPALRQAYRVARRGSLTVLTTDGLSDPFEDPELAEEQGFGLEFYIVTKDSMPSPLQGAWPRDSVPGGQAPRRSHDWQGNGHRGSARGRSPACRPPPPAPP